MAAAVAMYRFVAWASNVKNVVVDTTCRIGRAVCCCSCCGDEDSTNGDWVYREPTGIQEVPPYIDLTGSSLTLDETVERDPGSVNEKSRFCFCGEGPETDEVAVTVSSAGVVITEHPRALDGDMAIAEVKLTATDDEISAVPEDVSQKNEIANAVPTNAVPPNECGVSKEPFQEVATSSADDHGHDESEVKQSANLHKKDVSTADNSVVDNDDDDDDGENGVFPSFSLVQTINNKKSPRQLSPGHRASPSVSAPALQRDYEKNPSGAGQPEHRGEKISPRGGAGINLLKTASLNSFLSSVKANKSSLHAAMLDAADFGLEFLPACRPALPRQGSNPPGLSRYQVLVGKTWLSKLTAIGHKRHRGAKRRKAKMKDKERLVTQTTDGIRVVIEFGESTTL